MAGLPHSITRSVAGFSGGRPVAALSAPLTIASVIRPWWRNGSRVTVG